MSNKKINLTNILSLSENFGIIYFFYKKNTLRKAMYHITYPMLWFKTLHHFFSSKQIIFQSELEKQLFLFTIKNLEKYIKQINYTDDLDEFKRNFGKKFYGSSFIIIDETIQALRNKYYNSKYFSNFNVVFLIFYHSIKKFQREKKTLLPPDLAEISSLTELAKYTILRKEMRRIETNV